MNKIAESVWDYPRPPRLEPTARRIRIVHAGVTVADTTAALRLLETSHPPTYYLPPGGLDLSLLTRAHTGGSFCEFKGAAAYWNLAVPGAPPIHNAAWSYDRPTTAYAALTGYLAFYAGKLDECWVDEELAQPQPGNFYGGWVTSDLRGPFKGAPGTLGW